MAWDADAIVVLVNACTGVGQATVTAVDTTTNRVKVHTPEGQTIVLDMSPASLTSMQVGDPFTFTVPEPPR